MPAFSEFLSSGGEAAKQLFVWAVLADIARTATMPYMRDLEYLVNQHDPNIPLSPPDLAQAYVRHVIDKEQVIATGAKAGASAQQMETMLHLAAEPPGLQTVLQMYRRGIVQWGEAGPTKPTVANAIATSRIYTYWSTAIKHLNILPIPAAEMVDAAVEGQTTKGDRTAVVGAISSTDTSGLTPAATSFYTVMYANGYTPDQADLMFHTRGNPPSPMELIDLYNRGDIEWTGTGVTATTVQQGIYEGALKDKWEPIMKGLAIKIPSEYYLLTMMKTGQIPITVGARLLHAYGYTGTVIAGIVGVSQSESVATEKKLTKTVIKDLFLEKMFDATQAITYLMGIGLHHEAATFTVTAWEMTFSLKQTNAALSKTHTLFIDRKIDASAARAALQTYGISATVADTVLQTWTLERQDNVALLTSGEIADAVYYQLMTVTTGLRDLEALGYSPYDAWMRLGVRLHSPPTKTGPPPRGQTVSGTVV